MDNIYDYKLIITSNLDDDNYEFEVSFYTETGSEWHSASGHAKTRKACFEAAEVVVRAIAEGVTK